MPDACTLPQSHVLTGAAQIAVFQPVVSSNRFRSRASVRPFSAVADSQPNGRFDARLLSFSEVGRHGITCALVLDKIHPGPDYTLRWPRELFVLEANALRDLVISNNADWNRGVEWLLTEAFVADVPVDDFREASQGALRSSDPWGSIPDKLGRISVKPEKLFLQDLISAAERLPEEHLPRPYYGARTSHSSPEPLQSAGPDLAAAQRDWSREVAHLQERGYLDRVTPRPCVDDDNFAGPPDQDRALDAAIADRLGEAGLWRPRQESWDEVTFYSLVEVFHDLVARPRGRWAHNFNGCGWHYERFAPFPAQVLYRWKVNRLLERHGLHLMLAKTGEDTGRRVHRVDEGRQALVDSALNVPHQERRVSVAHAIALFRSRDASRDEKRSACTVLASLLEERRTLLKSELFKKDEGALFQIANEFAIRHRDAKQHPEYDDAYLDWVFWWYLATVELTDKLVHRQKS